MIRYIDEKGIISPVVRDLGVKVAVTTFSKHLFDLLIKNYNGQAICTVPGGIDVKVYIIDAGGKKLAAYMSPVGAPAAAGALEEVIAGSVDKVVAFGICGALTDIPTRNFVVPTRSYRDEGTSYHYSPPSDFVELKNSGAVAEHLDSCGIKYVTGGAWTTDGFYRETRTRMAEMTGKGCVAVDMESSALQTVCDYRGKDFYTFFITADSLAGEEWEPNYILDVKATSVEEIAVAAAVSLAAKL